MNTTSPTRRRKRNKERNNEVLHELISANALSVLKNTLAHVVHTILNETEHMRFIRAVDQELNVRSNVFREFREEHLGLFVG